MTMKKILAAVAATAIAGSAMASIAFAADVIDFENGSYDGIEMHVDDGADPSVLSVVDFNGSKALKVDVQDVANVPKVKFLVADLVGDAVADIAKVEMDVTVEAKDGVTPPGWMGGAIGSAGTDNAAPAWSDQAWEGGEYEAAVSQTMTLSKSILPIDSEKFTVGDAGAHFLLMRWATEVPYNMYIDNVKFYDKDGALITVNVAAAAPAPDAGSTDTGSTDTGSTAGGAATGVAPVAALAVATLAGAALVASKKR